MQIINVRILDDGTMIKEETEIDALSMSEEEFLKKAKEILDKPVEIPWEEKVISSAFSNGVCPGLARVSESTKNLVISRFTPVRNQDFVCSLFIIFISVFAFVTDRAVISSFFIMGGRLIFIERPFFSEFFSFFS